MNTTKLKEEIVRLIAASGNQDPMELRVVINGDTVEEMNLACVNRFTSQDTVANNLARLLPANDYLSRLMNIVPPPRQDEKEAYQNQVTYVKKIIVPWFQSLKNIPTKVTYSNREMKVVPKKPEPVAVLVDKIVEVPTEVTVDEVREVTETVTPAPKVKK